LFLWTSLLAQRIMVVEFYRGVYWKGGGKRRKLEKRRLADQLEVTPP
jgi:hypothetical protein